MEEILLKKLKKGDQKALGKIIDMYTGYATTIVYNIIGSSMSMEDVEEVVSDVFVEIWNASEKIEVGHLKGFISQVARFRALNKLRENHNEIPIEEDQDNEISFDGIPEDEILREETSEILRKTIDELGEPDSEIFLRHYYYCQTVNEIAEEIDISSSTIKSKLKRGREKLKAMLTNGGYFNESN